MGNEIAQDNGSKVFVFTDTITPIAEHAEEVQEHFETQRRYVEGPARIDTNHVDRI